MSNPDMDPKTVIPDAVVLAALNAEETVLRATAPWTTKEIPDTLSEWPNANVVAMRAALTAAADAINPKDDRPWERLTKDNPARVGDELRLNYEDYTITAVVAHVDENGDPWTAEGGFISVRRHGPWYVRRATPTSINPKDNPRWEPLNGRPVQEGDEVRWYHGTMYVRRTSQKTPMEDSTTNVP